MSSNLSYEIIAFYIIIVIILLAGGIHFLIDYWKEYKMRTLFEACQRQVDKYSGKVKMDRECDICDAVGKKVDSHWYDCEKCPLNGNEESVGCVTGNYIPKDCREFVGKDTLMKRRAWLVKTLNDNNIPVV